MEAYLLGDGGILLDPELIYADPETFQMGFCVVPGRKEDFNSQLSLFLQYLMKNIDHRDRECVVLTYGLYQTSMKDNYGMEDMMALLSKEEAKDLKTEKICLWNGKEKENRNKTRNKTEKEDMAEESSLYGLEMMHRRNGSYFLKKERSQIMDGACGRNCYFFFNCGYGSRRYLVSVWLVCIKKMWVYGAAGLELQY